MNDILFNIKKRLRVIVTMTLICLCMTSIKAQESETSQAQFFFKRIDREATQMPIRMKDSIFNTLMSKYISEYRTYGQDVALDSLASRSNEIIEKYRPTVKRNRKKTITTISSNREKLENLKMQKADIESQIANIYNEERPTKMSNLINEEIDKAHAKADSMTITQMTRNANNNLIGPIVFDSISHLDFQPLLIYSGIWYRQPKDTTKELPETLFLEMYRKNKIETRLWRRTIAIYAIEQPELIEYYDLNFFDNSITKIQNKRDLYIEDIDKYKSEPTFELLSKLMKKKETGPWSSYKKLTVHFSQYYVNNWYKGGTPNSTLLSILRYDKNYNKDNKITWDNSLYTEIGFYNTSQDTIRAFRVNNDEFDITSRFGYHSGYKKLYYSASGYFRTSLFTSYNGINSNDVLTSFFSPSTLTLGLGGDYRYNKKTFIQLSPLAYRLIFILDDRVNPAAQGIKHGKSSSFFGYMIYGELYWKFSREINFTSKANIFCSYPHNYMEMEIELVGNFIINRFLSSRISFKLRTDDKETTETGIQEQLSLGFNYEF